MWLRRPLSMIFVAVGIGVVTVAGAGGALALPSESGSAARSAHVVAARAVRLPTHVVRAGCDRLAAEGQPSCPLLLHTGAGNRAAATSALPAGYGPADIQSAYNLRAAASADGIGVTVAVVAPGDDPNAAKDLAVYRARYGLPPCTEPGGCIRVVNQEGSTSPLPPASASWAQDDSVELDMVSAICPNCHIVLVEAAGSTGLLTAEDSAVSVVHADVIVDGWQLGLPEIGYDQKIGQYFDHPGVAITAPAGDSGLLEQQYPASSQFVTAVGGTTLTRRAGSKRGWRETAWPDTAAGCSGDPKPSWQTDSGCAGRMVADVSAVADPTTGVAFYDNYQSSGWATAGGTVVAAAIIGGTYGLAGPAAANTYPASYPYRHASALNDVTQGTVMGPPCNDFPTYWCQAGPGYDGPTGWGTPDGIAGFQLGPVSHSIVTVIGVPYQQSAVGLAVTPLDMRAIDTTNATLGWSAAGLPPGLSIDPATGIISGTPTTVGTYPVAVTATDGAGSSTVHFTWNTRDVITFGAGSDGGWYAYGTAIHVQVVASDSASSEPLTYTASGLAPGLSIDPSSGVISGMMTKTGYWDANVTVSDPTGASVAAGYFFGDYGVIAVTPPANVTSVAGQPVTFGVHYTDTAPETVYVNLGNSPPGVWAYPFGPVRGWPLAAGVYHSTIDVIDGWGGDGHASFTWTVLPAPDSGPNGLFRVGGGCLSVPGAHPAGGTVVQVARCARTATEHWTYAQDGTLRVGGRCLLAPSAGTAASARLIIGACSSTNVVSWQIGQGGTLYNPITPGSSLCLTGRLGHRLALKSCQAGLATQVWQMPAGHIDAEMPSRCVGTSGKVAVGRRVVSVGCSGKGVARWTVSADGTIRSDGLCLAAPGGKVGSPLQLGRCGRSSSQQWQVRYFYDGSSEIQARSSGLCVTVPGAGTADGAAIVLKPCLTAAGYTVAGEAWRIQ
jgi:hypothetical protein